MDEIITQKEEGVFEVTKTEQVEKVEIIDVVAVRAQIAEWERAITEAKEKLIKVGEVA